MKGAQKAAEITDLAGSVRKAQEQIARAIRVGEMRGDPLCDVLEAMSTSLGAQLQLHEAGVELARLPIDPAALLRLEQAAASGAAQRAGELARAYTLRAILVSAMIMATTAIVAAAGGVLWERSNQAAVISSTEAGVSAAFRDGPAVAADWLNLMRSNDLKAALATCAGQIQATAAVRRGCAIPLWLDPPRNPAPATTPIGK